MKKPKLPYISIKGDTLQQLIEIEPILVMLGYDEPDEYWNNRYTTDDPKITPTHIVTYDNMRLNYHTHQGSDPNNKPFHASDIEGIINYVEKFKSTQK